MRLGQGRVADYIPELARIDAKKLGIAVATIDGDFVSCGDTEDLFSIQSISKVFTLALALGKVGDSLWEQSRPRAIGFSIQFYRSTRT